MRKLAFIAVIGILVVAGCDVDRSPTERPSARTFPPFEVKTEQISRQTGDCATDTSRLCTHVDMLYQLVSDTSRAEAVKRINAGIERGIAGVIGYDSTQAVPTPQQQADQFISDYEELARDFPESFGWEMNLSGEVLRNDSAFLVIRIRLESYSGGAHGNSNVQFMNFNPVTGEQVKLQELFREGYEGKLNRLALQAFQEARNLDPNEDMSTQGFNFYNDRYYNPDNFAILKDELVFYFNNYEVAPYSAGPTEIGIPVGELEEILL